MLKHGYRRLTGLWNGVSSQGELQYFGKLSASCVAGALLVKYGSLCVPSVTTPNIDVALVMIATPCLVSVVLLTLASILGSDGNTRKQWQLSFDIELYLPIDWIFINFQWSILDQYVSVLPIGLTKVGTPKIATFGYWTKLLSLDLSDFYIFLLVTERVFQRTKDCHLDTVRKSYEKLWRIKAFFK